MFEKMMAFVAEAFAPVNELIQKANTSLEEKLKLKQSVLQLEARFLYRMNEMVVELSKAQNEALKAGEQTGNWLSKSWRPIMMIFFLLLVALDTFGLLANPLDENVWLLLQIGMGGYVVGRSAEKVVSSIKGKKNGS